MRLTGRLPTPEEVVEQRFDEELATNERMYRALHEDPELILESLDPREREILAEARARLAEVGAQLRSADLRGELSVDVRTVLPFLVIFHWNRLGLDLDDHRAMSYSMATILSGEND